MIGARSQAGAPNKSANNKLTWSSDRVRRMAHGGFRAGSMDRWRAAALPQMHNRQPEQSRRARIYLFQGWKGSIRSKRHGHAGQMGAISVVTPQGTFAHERKNSSCGLALKGLSQQETPHKMPLTPSFASRWAWICRPPSVPLTILIGPFDGVDLPTQRAARKSIALTTVAFSTWKN